MTRLLFIGLDGGTDAVIRLADAKLPNIARLRERGASATLRSTVPPITAAAWPSMMTGWNPGRHGMYDFRGLAIDRYTRLWGAGHSEAFGDGHEFMTSRRWAGASLWDLAGEAGRRVGVLTVPMTYPAWEVNGDLVAGFPLPDYGRNFTSPGTDADDLPPLLEGADRLDSLDDAQLAALCARLIDGQIEVVRRWLDAGEHEVMVAVFQGTDFAQHRLWKYLERPGHPLREALLEMYRAIDRLVGEGLDALAGDGTVAIASDHGFGPHPRTCVHTDSVLASAGLLSLPGGRAGAGHANRMLSAAPRARRALRRLADRLPARARDWLAGQYTGASRVDWSTTRAYRIPLYAPAEGVVVNLCGRQEQGAVAPGAEYEAVRDEVIRVCEALRDPATGRPVVQWARRREDVFTGDHVEDAPDVVLLFDPAYKGSAGLGDAFAPVPARLLEEYSGVHAMDGVFAVAGPGVRAGVDLGTREIVDVMPTLLTLLGVPVPAGIDGRAMSEALREPASVTVGAESARLGDDDDFSLSAEEELTLERSLRSLGYLD
jgi:predicted AlkP superfamily phosphohydrolase/phosphomutase